MLGHGKGSCQLNGSYARDSKHNAHCGEMRSEVLEAMGTGESLRGHSGHGNPFDYLHVLKAKEKFGFLWGCRKPQENVTSNKTEPDNLQTESLKTHQRAEVVVSDQEN